MVISQIQSSQYRNESTPSFHPPPLRASAACYFLQLFGEQRRGSMKRNGTVISLFFLRKEFETRWILSFDKGSLAFHRRCTMIQVKGYIPSRSAASRRWWPAEKEDLLIKVLVKQSCIRSICRISPPLSIRIYGISFFPALCCLYLSMAVCSCREQAREWAVLRVNAWRSLFFLEETSGTFLRISVNDVCFRGILLNGRIRFVQWYLIIFK